MQQPAAILLDIEGTTTAIAFVHEVLFPYARERLPGYLTAHAAEPHVVELLAATKATMREEQGRDADDAAAVAQLLSWIASDRKHTALKTLQGYIWESGYRDGDYRAHLYGEVPAALRRWSEAGITLAIYSSGSVAAQKLLFAHTTEGDLTPLFSAYFDTHVGQKREADSYRQIAAELGVSPMAILFVSDLGAELDAAAQAGLQTRQSLRPGIAAVAGHLGLQSFDELRFE